MSIKVLGARVHNLKNIDVEIPSKKLTVITGLSGSGKSSLAFDTIYAEGQRRYIETFAAYARQFLGNMERPDVDKISGLSPVISIEQKTTNKNPRSTVGTITEIYDFFRLWYARASIAYSHITGEEMVKYTDEQIYNLILEKFQNKKVFILAPIVRSRKGHYRELFEQIVKKGFIYARINGEITEIKRGLKLDRYKTHNIEIVIDKLSVPDDKSTDEGGIKRLKDSIKTAMNHGKGITMIIEKDSNEVKFFSRQLMCPSSGISYDEPAPNSFSFNSPQGYCTKCKGLGQIDFIDIEKIIPDKSVSIYNGGIEPLGKYRNVLIFWQIEAILEKNDFSVKSPIDKIDADILEQILYGTDEKIKLDKTPLGTNSDYFLTYEGVIKYLRDHYSTDESFSKFEKYIASSECPVCNGTRLKSESLQFKIDYKNISEVSNMDIDELLKWLENIEERLTSKQQKISKEILKEIRARVGFLLDVGLSYLALNRGSGTLSGGESQRIRLATQIGSQLVNVLYILDEPSIGLHQRDNVKLINSLHQLRDSGNSVIVVEHDKEMILAADYVVDIGPHAGKYGGEIVGVGTPDEILKMSTLTAEYLNGKKEIAIPKERRKGNDNFVILTGAKGNNLKNVSVKFPLGTLICVTGVSGSGKSTLINETLQPILSQKFYRSLQNPLEYSTIEGIEFINKVIEVDQAPIGRTPRSNPATYTAVFTDIRNLFTKVPEAQIRGYKSGRFSFNVKGGRCEKCQGAGMQTIEMNFLPDVYVHCYECNGKRYNRETLEIRYKGKNISDVLEMTINDAVTFFENIPSIFSKVKAMQDVGLGYVTLGQSSTTLSGGEAQRVKLATELAKKDTKQTLYILDEPTTGLHFEDIRVLLEVLQKLVDKGNTIIIIEHNMDVIKVADYIIDIGPEGGRNGGTVVCSGTPEEVAMNKKSYTAEFLKKELKVNKYQ